MAPLLRRTISLPLLNIVVKVAVGLLKELRVTRLPMLDLVIHTRARLECMACLLGQDFLLSQTQVDLAIIRRKMVVGSLLSLPSFGLLLVGTLANLHLVGYYGR